MNALIIGLIIILLLWFGWMYKNYKENKGLVSQIAQQYKGRWEDIRNKRKKLNKQKLKENNHISHGGDLDGKEEKEIIKL